MVSVEKTNELIHLVDTSYEVAKEEIKKMSKFDQRAILDILIVKTRRGLELFKEVSGRTLTVTEGVVLERASESAKKKIRDEEKKNKDKIEIGLIKEDAEEEIAARDAAKIIKIA